MVVKIGVAVALVIAPAAAVALFFVLGEVAIIVCIDMTKNINPTP
jgi:hypothetical protein